MRIGVIIPSDQYRKQAGARIRYGRLKQALKARGHKLELLEVDEFYNSKPPHDAYLLSKINDTRATLCAHVLRKQGKLVGIDLFDDYFSQIADSRFSRLRLWLAATISSVDFVLCSTSAMADIVQSYRPDVPSLIMNDPLEGTIDADLVQRLELKLERARETRKIDIAWFGMGDNPYFRVGLSDLASCVPILAAIRDSDWEPRLRILTNDRALNVEGLAYLKQLPVPFELDIWTEEKERALLDRSLVCLLPVNAQNFSIAKSLNRAMTALSSACQVVSPGYPLYSSLNPLIYNDGFEFLEDLSNGALRLRKASQATLFDLADRHASAQAEAAALCAFLQSSVQAADLARAETSESDIAVVHGVATRGEIHKLTSALGGLSVASPFCTANLAFDIRFLFSGQGADLVCYISEKILDRLTPRARSSIIKHGRIGDRSYWRLASQSDVAEAKLVPDTLTPPVQLYRYEAALKAVADQLRMLLGDIKIVVSETSALPFGDRTLQLPCLVE